MILSNMNICNIPYPLEWEREVAPAVVDPSIIRSVLDSEDVIVPVKEDRQNTFQDNVYFQLSVKAQQAAIELPQNFLRLKDSISDLIQLSPEGQRTAIEYPQNFLLLQDNIGDLIQLSPEGQEEAIGYPQEFLQLKDNIGDLIQLSPKGQQEAIAYPQNFLLLQDNIGDLIQLSPEGQRAAIAYPQNFLQLKDSISDLIQFPLEIQGIAIRNSESFLLFYKSHAIKELRKFSEDRISFFLNDPAGVSPSDGELYTLIFPYIANWPDSKGVTLLHKFARNGDLESFSLYSKAFKGKHSEIIINRKAYFSEQTWRDCTAFSQLSEIDKIPLKEFAIPRSVAQNYCNTRIRMANGKIRTFTNTNAKDAYNSLVLRSNREGMFFANLWKRIIGDTSSPMLPNNRLTLYLNPGHSFIDLACTSCAEDGTAFHESRGFYPGGLYDDESGVAYSNKHQYLKVDFYISDEQAKNVWFKQKSIRKDPSIQYKPETRNCVDVAAMIVNSIGESRPFDFFTDEQLSVHFEFFSNGKFRLPSPGEAPAIWYADFKHRASPLRAGLFLTVADILALQRYPAHQLQASTYFTGSIIILLSAYMVYKVVMCFLKNKSS